MEGWIFSLMGTEPKGLEEKVDDLGRIVLYFFSIYFYFVLLGERVHCFVFIRVLLELH